jgi:uncharacterized protein (DUF1697 family)
MKFANVATFIASGNMIFDSPHRDGRKLVDLIERHLPQALGYDVDTFIRTRAEVEAVTAFQPFSKADMEKTGNTIHIGFWKEAPDAALVRGLLACRTEVDEFCVEGREFYWLCRIKTHESKVWSSPAMRALKLPTSTARNLTSLRKLISNTRFSDIKRP